MHWDIEAGLGYRVNKVDKNSTAEDDEEAIIRLGTLYNWQLSETADFSQEVSVETGDSNTISLSETALNIQVINEIFLKLSYVLKYTEETPDDKKHADTETRISLSYKF